MGIYDNGRPVTPIREVRAPKPDQKMIDLLTPEEQAEIRKEARRQVLEDQKKAARAEFLAHAVQEARSELEPAQEMFSLLIDLAGHSKNIVLDMGVGKGGVYHHGHTYEVPRTVYCTLREIMHRGWAHEEETGIPNHKLYRRPAGLGLNYNDPNTRVAPLAPRIGNADLNRPAEVILHGG